MKTHGNRLATRVIAVAIRSALLVMCAAPVIALAQEAPSDEVTALIYPTSFFDLGVLAVDSSSTKFGEYNGLNDSGPYVLANFNVRAGPAYGMGDGTTRV